VFPISAPTARTTRHSNKVPLLLSCFFLSTPSHEPCGQRKFYRNGGSDFTYQFIAFARQKWIDDCRLKWKLKASKILQNCFTLCNLVYYGILVVKIVFYFSFVSKFRSAFLLLAYLCFTYSTFVFVFSSVKSGVSL